MTLQFFMMLMITPELRKSLLKSYLLFILKKLFILIVTMR